MTADDGTQDRTIEAIERAMAIADVSNREMARSLGLSEPQWSNVKAGRQVLAPWMLRRIAKRLGSAGAVVEHILAATGEDLIRHAAEASPGPQAQIAAQLGAKVAGLTVSVLTAEADGVFDVQERAAIAAELDGIAHRVAQLRAGLGRAA